MLYQLARPIARYVLSWYYRRITMDGLENIPEEGPVILASNHPTAFIEPCILACYQPRKLWFLARGNLFKNKLVSSILNGLHILPVFRIKDGGYGKLKNNFSTFQTCRKALAKGKAIMILAEGRCIHEKRLRPIRKGTGRIALSALAEHPDLKDIPIIPIGVNFTTAERMRGEVYIRFGKALSTATFLEAYQQNENQGVLQLTNALRAAIDPLVVQIPAHDLDGVGETLLTVGRNELHSTLTYGFGTDSEVLNQQLAISKTLDTVDKNSLEAYGNRLLRHQLKDAAVSGSWSEFLTVDLVGWCKYCLACLLLLWHLPLLLLGEYIGGTATRKIEFYSPVRFAVVTIGMLAYPFFWLIGLNPWLMAYTIISIISAKWMWKQLETVQRWYQMRMAWRQIPQEREVLKQLRDELTKQLPC